MGFRGVTAENSAMFTVENSSTESLYYNWKALSYCSAKMHAETGDSTFSEREVAHEEAVRAGKVFSSSIPDGGYENPYVRGKFYRHSRLRQTRPQDLETMPW